MLDSIKKRVILEAHYLLKEKTTIRKCAKAFNISKSTVHNDLSNRLEKIDTKLYKKVREIIEINKSQRHLRGGLATKEKYGKIRNEKEKGKNS